MPDRSLVGKSGFTPVLAVRAGLVRGEDYLPRESSGQIIHRLVSGPSPDCSAELHSAVPPNCIRDSVRRLGAVTFKRLQIENLRYSRVQLCATPSPTSSPTPSSYARWRHTSRVVREEDCREFPR